MQQTDRTIVGHPLTPTLIKDLSALDPWEGDSDDSFDPIGAWENTYRIWRCHGYRESGNEDSGYLKLAREPNGPGKFTLSAEQFLVNSEFIVRRTSAKISCRDDPLGSPESWEIVSSFLSRDGSPQNNLEKREKGTIRGDELHIEIADQRITRSVIRPLTADWCLFEAVQRLDKNASQTTSLNLLEGLSLFKASHTLTYRGSMNFEINGSDKKLFGFQHIGKGILPFEYWLGENDRLLVATTFSVAYILDSSVIEATRKRVADNWKQFSIEQGKGEPS